MDVSVASLCDNSPNIKYLSIECCAISDASLISLKKLYLHTLNINGCKKITDKGFKELFDAEKYDDFNLLIFITLIYSIFLALQPSPYFLKLE